jgi:hypothetical protein
MCVQIRYALKRRSNPTSAGLVRSLGANVGRNVQGEKEEEKMKRKEVQSSNPPSVIVTKEHDCLPIL